VNSVSFDILGQRDFDLWIALCAAAALVLLSYAVARPLWRTPRGWLALVFIAAGVAGTALVIALPSLHSRFVGLWWTPITLVLLAATFYLSLLPTLGIWRVATLLTFRTIALAMLVSMLFDPVLRYVHRPRPERPMLICIDASGSMSFPDVQNGPTRIQSVWQTLRPQLPKIKEHFIPQFFTFATSLQLLDKPDELAKLQADGKATDIVGGLNALQGKSSAPDAAIILISDGIDNTSPSVVDALKYSSRPIHTVSVGSDQAEPATMANIAVENVETADDFTVNHETKVKATIKSSALPNRVVDVKMAEVDDKGKIIGETASDKLVLQPLPEGQAVELPYKPRSVGVHRLAVWVDPVAGERSTIDNRQEFQGLALDPRIKVLYIEGRVRPEYTQLNRALNRDPNMELATLLRIQQDRFTASGNVDGQKFTKMPATMDEWKRFDVVILGDLDSSFLSKIQQESIEQLTVGGAGLLMVGGQNNFGPGGYENTPIEKALPVFVGGLESPQEKSEFVPRLTAEGASHPAMEGLADWFGVEENKGAKELPPLRGNVVVPRAKSGAQILATHADRLAPDGAKTGQIVLAVERYGKGRSAAFTIDTTYLWYIPLRAMGQDSPYNRLWGQLVRWLAGEDVKNRQRGAGVEGLLNKSLFQLGESVKVRAMVRDERGDATRYAQVNLTLKGFGKEEKRQFPLAPSEARTGMYEVTIPNPDKGDYVIELSATKDGKPLGKQELKFTVIPPADEMLKIAANPTLLAQLADHTKGFHYRLEQLPTLIDELIKTDPTANTAKAESVRLSNFIRTGMALSGRNPTWNKKYDLPMQGMLIVVILAGEWMLRRKWELL
jgi:uncharacterized membrane protein